MQPFLRREARPLLALPPPGASPLAGRPGGGRAYVAGVRYHVLATDFDGTLADEGRVAGSTLAALERVRASGRRLVLVTGRLLADLRRVFPRTDLFDLVVAENGATCWRPGAEERALAPPPPPAFLDALRARGVPFAAGRSILETRTPHDVAVLHAIRELGLELHVVFNKGAAMVLPAATSKRSGLEAALGELALTWHETVAVGDGENDHAMLAAAECGAAVASAVPALKDTADLVTRGGAGAGVEELAAALLADDLASVDPRRHHLRLGTSAGAPVSLSPAGARVLVAGPSGSGKSTAATGLLEQLFAAGYQVCLVDPEGDYEGFPGLVPLGTEERAPSVDELLALLADPRASPAASLLGLPIRDRPRFLADLWPRLQELRARTGRPHWIALDEAHHLLPRDWQATSALPADPGRLLLVTVHPARVSPAVLREVTAALAVGDAPEATLAEHFHAIGRRPPPMPGARREGEVLAWRAADGRVVALEPAAPRAAHRRHRRKYAGGDVREKAFVFRGPEGKLRLRAQNLKVFLQLAEGVDDATWLHHLARGDYSRWFREAIKDEALAGEAEQVERERPDAEGSRRCVREAVERRYVLVDEGPAPLSPAAGEQPAAP